MARSHERRGLLPGRRHPRPRGGRRRRRHETAPPLIAAFGLAGVLVGPAGLGWGSGSDSIVLLSELGIAVLFLVGLTLDLPMIRRIGSVALPTGLGKIAFTSVIGFALALLFGSRPFRRSTARWP